MLRDLVGDATLSAALRAYDPAKDTGPDSFEKLIEQAGQRRNLSWFFADWVYADKGLPDLSIDSVFPSTASVAGSYLVAVNLTNNGYAAVEAPVQVLSDSTTVTQRILMAARSKSTQRILIQGIPTEVRLNDGTIPETQATVHSKTLENVLPH
jgi:archaellum component FlaF (FlaF/FlaG flagellin family)